VPEPEAQTIGEKIEGPYLLAAVLCERVLEEKDGVVSVIRIVDRIVHTPRGPHAPEKMPAVPVALTLFVSLKSGFARGRFNVRVRAIDPAGGALSEVSLPILLEGGDDRGVQSILPLFFVAQEEGLHWFEIRFEERLLTRVPLRLVYQPFSMGTPPPPGA
jgi:hypothetical protein